MNPTMRANRILKAIPNFQYFSEGQSPIFDVQSNLLGRPIGNYRNSEKNHDAIEIFENGLAWQFGRETILVKYSDISELALSSGKESKSIMIKTRSGNQYDLPINGQRGRFYDSMEVLRFLDRVVEDLRNLKIEHESGGATPAA